MAEDSTGYTPISVSTGADQDVLDYEYQQGEKARQYLNAITGIVGNLDRSAGEVALDTGKNIVAGALTGVTDSASFLTGLAGLDTLSRGLASVSESIEQGAQKLGSRGERAQREWYQLEQAKDAEKAQKEFYSDVASGKKSVLEATAAREAKNFLSATRNAFKTGYAGEVISSGFGSLGSDILLSGGMSAAAKTAAKALPTLAKSAKALSETNKFTQGIAKNAPWMSAVGLEEGGNQYRQQLNDALEIDTATLMAQSPEFRARVEERLAQLPLEQRSNPEVVQRVVSQVKYELAADAARDAGIKTAALAMALSPLTKWAQKPFEIGGRSAKRLVGEALTEPAEETITEGGGQIASNTATQRYLNPSQDIGEGVGEGGALGGIGGLGITAVRGTPVVAVGALGSGIRAGSEFLSTHNSDRRAKNLAKLGEEYKDTFAGSGLDTAGQQLGQIYTKMQSFGKNLENASTEDLNNLEKELGAVSEGVVKVSDDFFSEEARPTAQKFANQVQEQVQDLARKINQARIVKFNSLAEKIQKDPSKLEDSDIQSMEAQIADIAARSGQLDTKLIREQLKNKIGEKAYSTYEAKLKDYNSKAQARAKEKFLKDTEGLKEGDLTFERMLDLDNQAKNQGLNFANKDYTGRDNPSDDSLSSQAQLIPHYFNFAAENLLNNIYPNKDTPTKDTDIVKAAWLTARGRNSVESRQKEVFKIFEDYTKNDDFIDKANVPVEVKQDVRDMYSKYEASKKSQPQPTSQPKPTSKPTPAPQPQPAPVSQPKVAPTSAPEVKPVEQPAEQSSNTSTELKPWSNKDVGLRGKQFKQGQVKPVYDTNTGTLSCLLTPKDTFVWVPEQNAFVRLEDSNEKKYIDLIPYFRQYAPEISYQPSSEAPQPTQPTEPIAEPIAEKPSEPEVKQPEVGTEQAPQNEPELKVEEQPASTEPEVKTEAPVEESKEAKPVEAPKQDTFNIPGALTKNGRDASITLVKDEQGNTLIQKGNEPGVPLDIAYPDASKAKIQDAEKILSDENTSQADKQQLLEELEETSKQASDEKLVDLRDKDLKLTKCTNNQLLYIMLDAVNMHQDDALRLLKHRGVIFVIDPDGNVSTEEKDLSAPEYAEEMLGGITKEFTPITRAIHLLRGNPLEIIRSLANDPEQILEVLRKNNAITAQALYKRLTANDGELLADLKHWFNPKGFFVEELTEGIKEKLKGFSEFQNVDQDKFTQLGVIVAAHILATTAVMQQQNLMPILERYGYKADDGTQPNLDNIEGGYLLQALADNAQTTFRKFMGVAISETADLDTANKFLAQGAQAVLETLVEKGYLETFEVGLNKDIINDQGYRETVEQPTKFIKPAEDFAGRHRIFKREAGILAAILDTNFKNVIHTHIPSVAGLIANTSQVITPEQAFQLKAYNRVPYTVNERLWRLQNELGADDMYTLFNEQVTNADMPYRNAKDFLSAKGKKLSYDQSVTFVDAAVETKAKIFFRNVILRNARAMQQGSVTPQNNKHCRAFMSPIHDTMDISNRYGDMFKFWSLGLAQKWGAKTNGMDKAIWAAKVIQFMDTALEPNLKKFDEFYEIVKDKSNPTAFGSALQNALGNQSTPVKNKTLVIKKAIAEFNKLSEDFQITDFEGLNAFMEMLEYFRNVPGRTEFDSNVFIEIDGINDGPHHISAFYGAIFENFNAESLKRLTQTGIYTGVEANATLVNDPDLLDDAVWEERKKILSAEDIARIEAEREHIHKFWGTTGQDFHRQVAEKAIPKYLCSRIVAFNNTDNGQNKALGKQALRAALILLKATGFLKTTKSIKDIVSMTQLPADDDYGFTFTRDISKKLTTIIPYGSQPKGSMRQIVDMIFTGFKSTSGIYAMISKKLAERTDAQVDEYRLNYLDHFKKAFNNGTSFIIDTETTGLDTKINKVVQIAIQKVEDGYRKGKPTIIYINTDEHGQQIPEKLNGEVNPLVEAYARNKDKAVSAKEAAKQLQKIIGNAPIFGHNINNYDIAILKQHLGIPLKNPAYDSLELARILRPGQEASLQKLAQAFNLVIEGNAHLADSDINTNFEVISKLIDWATDGFTPKLTLEAKDVESTDDFNGVAWVDLVDAVNTLCGMDYNKARGEYKQVSSEERATRVKHFTRYFPTAEELLSIAKPFTVIGKRIFQKIGVDKDGKDIRNEDIPQNAEVTSKGLDKMASVLEAAIGEPAQAGVEEVLGTSAMRTERVSMALGQVVSLVARQVEKALGRPKTMMEAIRYRQFLNSVSGTLDINGTRAFIEKTGYSADTEPLTESKSLGIKFFSMLSHITDAGVAGGALSIQAAGDATMVRILATLLSAVENFSFKHIFDGLDTHPSKLKGKNSLERLANLASSKTIEAKLLAAVQNMLLDCGKNLKKIDRLELKATDPYELIKEILDKAILDENDGEQVAYNILRANNSLQQDIEFLANPESSVQRRAKNNRELQVQKHLGHRVKQINQALDELFSTTKVLVAAEASAKEVNKQVPISVNHMCAIGIPYSQRGILSREEADKLMDEVLATGIDGIHNYNELMAAYKATLRLDKDLTEEVTKGFTAEEKEKYAVLMHTFPKGDIRRTLPPAVMDIVTRVLGGKATRAKEELQKETQTYQTRALVDSLRFRAEQFREKNTADIYKTRDNAFSAIYARIAQLLPETVKRSTIHFVPSIDALPLNVQVHFDTLTKGFYDKSTGNIWIIADPEKGTLPLSIEDKKVLLHELIHATVSLHIDSFYGLEHAKDIKLTSTQEHALRNLDLLLDRFITEDLTDRHEILKNFQQLLKSKDDTPEGKAARMNEALAYIISDTELLDQLSKIKFDDATLTANTKRFYKLMRALGTVATKVFRAICRILPASVLNNYQVRYTIGLVNRKNVEVKALDFMGLFGLTTRVFLGDKGTSFNPPKGGKSKPASKINSDVKGLKYLDLTLDAAHEPTFKNNLKDDVTGAVFAKYYANPKFTEAMIDAKIDERVGAIRDYANALETNLSLGVSKANKVADLAVTLMEPHFLNAHDRDILTKGYLEIKDKLPKHFLLKDPSKASKEELEASEKIHDLITGKKNLLNIAGVKQPEGLELSFEAPALFYAMAKEHPEFFDALGEILSTPEDRKAVPGEGAFKKAIETLAVKARNYMEGSLKKKSATSFINETLQQNEDLFNRKNVTFFDRLHNWARTVDRFINAKINYVITKGLLTLSKDSLPDDVVQELAKAASKVPVSHHQIVMDALAFLNNSLIKNQDINTTIAELFGRTTNNRYVQAFLKRIKGGLDKNRSAYLERLPEIIEKSFIRKLKDNDRMYLTRVFGSYDVKIFGENFNELSKLLTDKQAVQAKWDTLKKELETKYGTLSKPLIQKIEQFGEWKAGTRESGHGLLTNPHAIVALLATEHINTTRASDEAGVKLVDQLMTLACLKRMSEGDRATAKDFLTNEKKGVITLVAWLEASKQHEQKRLDATAKQETSEKTSRNASYRFNYIKGWTPAGNQPRGLYRLVPKKDREAYEIEGYHWLGDYKGSELDTEPMCRMWNPNPYSNDLQEGILQSITQTGFGYQIENGTRGEALGTRILDSDIAIHILQHFDAEKSKNGVIPVFDAEGNTIGYERSIPPEDRQKLEEHTDIISGLGQWYVRQEREDQAGVINQELVDHLATMWHNAKGVEKSEFVDVFASDDPHIQKALSRFDRKTLARIHKAFGNHFWIRRDSVAATIGYYSASPVDLWDGTFFLPEKIQKGIVTVLEAILGKKAKYYVGKGFDITRGIVSTARDTIVIRSIVVPVMNIASNILNLHFGLGIPIPDIIRLTKESIVATETYTKLYNKKIDLEAALIMPGADIERIQHQLTNIRLRMENLSVYSLIKAGEFSTISSQGRIFEDVEFLKQSRADLIDYLSSKIPKPLQTLGSNILMTKNSEVYQALTKMVNYGDWIAKCVGYRYLTEKSGTRNSYFTAEKATDIVSTMFVDYDQFMGRGRRFLNDIGFSMFFSFMYRMIPATLLSMLMNPFRMLIGTALGKFTGVGTPLLDNWVTRLLNGNLSSSIMWQTLLRSWTLHPAVAILR